MTSFNCVRVLIDQSLVFCVAVCRSLFIPLSLSFWPPLYCMSFDLRPLVSSFRIYSMWSHQSDIYRFTPVSGCVGMGLSSLLCPGAYDAVKTASRIIIFISNSGFVCTYSLACSKSLFKQLKTCHTQHA
jgi:hypothetical protein